MISGVSRIIEIPGHSYSKLVGFCAILVFNSSPNHVYAWLLRSFTRAQTNSTRACALVGPGVATPLYMIA